ncbi:hypothetical protein [Nostoc sp. TCL240-02]|uniref:hypothetical protein n=1 Tax=Nostoc sp. TCL240-02 TaxID=2572090 RepID=UPI00157FB893|nr:hypothetical protein [Nostoc sp. TCL240-02]QKQ75643.1 hypothetical protein FBB35_22210 [Nostoc sp. TCL240-02]
MRSWGLPSGASAEPVRVTRVRVFTISTTLSKAITSSRNAAYFDWENPKDAANFLQLPRPESVWSRGVTDAFPTSWTLVLGDVYISTSNLI